MIHKLFSYDFVFWVLLMIMIVAGTVAVMMPKEMPMPENKYTKLTDDVYMVQTVEPTERFYEIK